MKIFSASQVDSLLPMRDAIQAVREAYMLYSSGACESPLRTQISTPDGHGNFLFMPSYCAELGYACIKNINLFPDNKEYGLPTSSAAILLIDGKTGRCLAVLDGDSVTRRRTAGSTGAAFSALANLECETAAIFGTGSQAAAQVEALFCERNPRVVKVWSRNPENAAAFAERMQSKYSANFLSVSDGGEAAANSDLIITATASHTPLFPADAVKPGATLSCIGNYDPTSTELPLDLFKRVSGVYYDAESAVLTESGELIMALEQNFLSRNKLKGELGLVLSAEIPGRLHHDEIIVFKSVGIGIQDLIASKIIFQKSLKSATL